MKGLLKLVAFILGSTLILSTCHTKRSVSVWNEIPVVDTSIIITFSDCNGLTMKLF